MYFIVKSVAFNTFLAALHMFRNRKQCFIFQFEKTIKDTCTLIQKISKSDKDMTSMIPILLQEPEDQDGYDNEIDSFFTPKLDSKRWRCKKLERKKYNISEEEKKKKAAIECLTAISDEVSSLCSRRNKVRI